MVPQSSKSTYKSIYIYLPLKPLMGIEPTTFESKP